MRFKLLSVAMIMLLILACSVSVIYAEEASVGDYKFTVPEGYSVNETSDDFIILAIDSNHSITLLLGDAKDSSDSISYLESKGYEYIGGDSYSYNDYDIVQQNYNSQEYTVYAYICTSDMGNFIITLSSPKSEPALNGTDNPVTQILDSIHKF